MVQTGFWIGNRDWWIMAQFDISSAELQDVYEVLLSVGVPGYKAHEVCQVLSRPNKGYTYTDYDGRFSLMFASEGTDIDELYDSIDHEKRHVLAHIEYYYGVEPKSEEAAYLAGELGRLLFPAIAIAVCDKDKRKSV